MEKKKKVSKRPAGPSTAHYSDRPGERRQEYDPYVFSERLDILRRESGLSKRRFAAMVGTSHSVISWWERGRNNPSIYMIFQIARECGVSVDWLIGLIDERKKLYEP